VEGISHPSFVTNAGILTSHASTAGLRRRFAAGMGTLSYRAIDPKVSRTPQLRWTSLSPVTLSALEHLTSELLRTLSRMACPLANLLGCLCTQNRLPLS